MQYNLLPDLDYLRSILEYDPDTGIFIRIKDRNNRFKKGQRAGYLSKSSEYMQINIGGKGYRLHRVAYYMYHEKDPGANLIDHINGNKLDNRIINLREVDNSKNQMNRKLNSNSTTGHKGITLMNTRGVGNCCYLVRVRKDGKRNAKCFPYSPEGLQQAITYRDKKLKELHGEFARIE